MTSGRLARNTAVLFGRQFIILAINLYSIRYILSSLGIEDFALYNVVLNIVLLGSFMTGAIGMLTQRFFSFAIGQDDPEALKRVHDTSLVLWAAMIFLVVLACETLGVWFISHRLVVEPDRLFAAQVLFQIIIVTFVIGSFSGFHGSAIMAHEDMHVSAMLSVLDAVLRFLAVLSLGWMEGDLLILYGLLLCSVSLIGVTLQWRFVMRHYPECRFGRLRFDPGLLRQMLGFTGWSLFGQFSTVSRNQAVTILINQSFSPATVAARALSWSVATQVMNFSTNFTNALHPPIIKAYAAGDKGQMFSMIFLGSRIAFFLVWIATLPLMAILPGVLHLWLGDYPAETALFTRLALVENAITAISLPLMTAVRATGRMQLYEISLGLLQLSVLLLSWLLIRTGHPAVSVYLVAIMINLMMFGVRLAIVSRQTGLPAGEYLIRVLYPVLAVVVVSSALVLAVFRVLPDAEILSLTPASLAGAALICILPLPVVYILGLNRAEKYGLKREIRKRLGKLREGA